MPFLGSAVHPNLAKEYSERGGPGRFSQNSNASPIFRVLMGFVSLSSFGRKRKKRKNWSESSNLNFSGIFYDFIAYMLFVSLFMITLLGSRNSNGYWFKKSLDNFFFENEFEYGVAFNDVASMSQFWTFMNNTLLPNLFPTIAYSGLALNPIEQRFLSDSRTYRLGYPRLRLIRMKTDLCRVPREFGYINECVPTYRSSRQEETADYYPKNRYTENRTDIFWKYIRTGSPSYRSPNTKITYSGNGYVEDLGRGDHGYQVSSREPTTAPSTLPTSSLPPTDMPIYHTVMPTSSFAPTPNYPTISPTNVKSSLVPRAQAQLQRIRKYEWIDMKSRALFIEINCYQPNTDLVSTVTMCIEFTSSGAIMSSFDISSSSLLRPLRALTFDGVYGSTIGLLLVEIVLYVMVLAYIGKELNEWRACHQERQPYFVGWNVVDVINLILFLNVIFFRVRTVYRTKRIDWLAIEFNPEIQSLLWQARFTDRVNAINAILVFIKIFKFTEQHPKLGQFTNTLKCAASDIGNFLLILILMLMGFGMGFNLAFGSDVRSYMDIFFSFQTLFACTLGDFNLGEISGSHFILGPVLFISFIIMIFFIILSMLLTIIDSAYDQALHEAAARGYSEDLLSRDIFFLASVPRKSFKAFLNGAVSMIYWTEGLVREKATHFPAKEQIKMTKLNEEEERKAKQRAFLIKAATEAENFFEREQEQVRQFYRIIPPKPDMA